MNEFDRGYIAGYRAGYQSGRRVPAWRADQIIVWAILTFAVSYIGAHVLVSFGVGCP